MISNLKLLNMGLEINSVCSNFLVWFSYHVRKIVSGRNEMTKYSRDPLITLQQHTRKDGRAQCTHIFVNSWFNRNTSITLPSGFHVTIRTAVIRMNFIIGDDSFENSGRYLQWPWVTLSFFREYSSRDNGLCASAMNKVSISRDWSCLQPLDLYAYLDVNKV